MMSVDEALTLAETVLEAEEEPLNDVQEIIFRECWQGRTSYEAIAHVSGYDKEYLKCAGAKLWQQLSDAFGEKVKKSNLKSVIRRYAQQHHLKPRNLVIEVNLSGASISGDNIGGENMQGHLREANFCLHDSPPQKTSQEKPPPRSKFRHRHFHSSEKIAGFPEKAYQWHGWEFDSEAEVKIAEALDRTGVLFFPNAQGRLTSATGRENSVPGFLICYQGKWGLLAVKKGISPENVAEIMPENVAEIMPGDDERSRLFQSLKSQGIHLIADYDVAECLKESDRIVQDFLDHLSNA